MPTVWFFRIVTMLVALLGLVLVVMSFPFNDPPHIVLGLTGVGFAIIGGMVVWNDIQKIRRGE